MADFRAINAVGDVVLTLLGSNYSPNDFNMTELEFSVYLASNFKKGMNAGVSLFMYRVLINGTHRTPFARPLPDGQRHQTMLPLDLHFILTAWGKKASLSNTITGWMMRVMEDNPVIPSSFLQNVAPGVFRDNETIEISPADLSTEDMLRLWEAIGHNNYHLSIPYVARNIRIESMRILSSGKEVQEREFCFEEKGKLNGIEDTGHLR